MTDLATLLERLRDPSPDGASARLAGLLVEDALGRTVGEIVDARVAAATLREALRAFTSSDAAEAKVIEAINDGERLLAAEKRKLGVVVSASLKAGARELAAVPMTPPREVVAKLLDREPLKKLLRAQVTDTLIAFGRKAASPVSDNAIARGLGGLGKFAMGQAGKPSAFGALANAVSGEVERQVEKRAADFADTAVAGILDGLAEQISDPARAKDQAAMRQALVDGFLELSVAQTVQLAHGPVSQRVAVVRRALAAWSAEAAFETEVETLVTTVLGKEAGRTLGEVLGEVGLKDVVVARAKALVQQRMAAFVSGEPFAEWLRALYEG